MDCEPTAPDVSSDQGLGGLLDRLAASNRETDWAEFIVRYGAFIRATCRGILHRDAWIDDAVQDTLISLQRSLPNYRRRGEAEAWAWVRAIAAGSAQRILESEQARSRRQHVVSSSIPIAADTPDEADAAGLSEAKERLVAGLRQLTPLQCDILRRRFVDGASNEDIARDLRMTVASIQRQGHRALTRLRALLAPRRTRERNASLAMALALLCEPGIQRQMSAAPPSAAAGIAWGTWSAVAAICATAAIGATAGVWYLGHPIASPPPTPASPAVTGPSAAPIGAAALVAVADPAAQAFIQRFKDAHPNWRMTDLGGRLGDPRAWGTPDHWRFAGDGGTARITVFNPEADLRRARLTLRTSIDPDRTAMLLVATLAMETWPGRSGFRLGIVPRPDAQSAWAGMFFDVNLSPRLLSDAGTDVPGEPQSIHQTIGIAVDARTFAYFDGVQTTTAPRVPEPDVCLELSLFGRRMVRPQTITVGDVRILRADAGVDPAAPPSRSADHP